MKTVAITGGTGYIAGLVIKEFLEAGYEVRASVRSAEKGEQLARLFRSVVGEGVAGRFSAFIADLSKAEGWKDGFRGVDGIIHVASPLGTGKESADELSAISVGGVMHVFQGAKAAGVDRIVMTSSEAAATALRSQAELLTDDFWTDENNPEIDAYRRSKLRSERAAWDFAEKNGIKLTTILPGAVFGPIIDSKSFSTNEVLLSMLNGRLFFTADVPLEVSNTEDLARLHRLAFENDIAIGQRYLAGSQTLRMPAVARILKDRFPDKKSPKFVAPGWLIRTLGLVIPDLRAFHPMLGRQYHYTCEKAETQLGWVQHAPEATIVDAAQSLIDHGLA